MGHIKIDELSNSLKEYINTLGLTEEQVNNLIKQFSGDKTQLQTNAKGSLVDAINELFQNANNGKELIANAIGEPLNSSDTFSAMSTGINSLLSTFKTNMMNNGVSVTGSDKFKQLIDKIATLADNEGKGIQYAEGTYRDFTEYLTTTGTSVEVSCNLNFTPTLIFVMFDSISNTAGTTISNAIISNKAVGRFYMNYTLSTMVSDITSNGFSMVFTYGNNSNITFNGVTWYAIGVGEEDTTLRDSLASILEEEGVIVAPEDDMANLITKVDEEFARKNSGMLNIISATELPAAGVDNQICVITDNIINNFVITHEEGYTEKDKVIVFTSNDTPNYETGGNINQRYYISSVYLNDKNLDSYYYKNSVWNRLTISGLQLLLNGKYMMSFVHGGLPSGPNSYTESTGITMVYTGGTHAMAAFSFANTIDLTPYSTLEITMKTGAASNISFGFYILGSQTVFFNYTGTFQNQTVIAEQTVTLSTTKKTFTFDISSKKGNWYIGLGAYTESYDICVTDMKLY